MTAFLFALSLSLDALTVSRQRGKRRASCHVVHKGMANNASITWQQARTQLAQCSSEGPERGRNLETDALYVV